MSAQSRKTGHQLPDKSVVADLYFLEHRAKLIDIAAFLDRYDRADGNAGQPDFRVTALIEACGLLTDGKTNRVRRVLEFFSNLSDTIPQSALGIKGATGAVRSGGSPD
jgi:hypothetical protein